MLSGFKNLYSKSVEAIKQVQDQVVAKKPHSATQIEQAVPIKKHPGYDLLDGYEKSWEEITAHGNALKNKLSAEETKVKAMADRCESEFSAWANLKDELSNLAAVTKGANNLKDEMEAMCDELQQLDEALDGHLKAKEERDLVRWKSSVAQETSKIQAARTKDFETLERSLKAEQDSRIRKKAAEEAKQKREAELAAKKEAQRVAEEGRKAAAAKAKEEKEEKEAKAKEEKEKAEAKEREEKEKAEKAKADEAATEKEQETAPVAVKEDEAKASEEDGKQGASAAPDAPAEKKVEEAAAEEQKE